MTDLARMRTSETCEAAILANNDDILNTSIVKAPGIDKNYMINHDMRKHKIDNSALLLAFDTLTSPLTILSVPTNLASRCRDRLRYNLN
jgi:hypothetical protein